MWDLNDILWDNLRTNNIMIWCVWNHHHSAWKWSFRVYIYIYIGLTALLRQLMDGTTKYTVDSIMMIIGLCFGLTTKWYYQIIPK